MGTNKSAFSSTTVLYRPKAGTFTARLQCATGDITQNYDGEYKDANATDENNSVGNNCSPNFNSSSPIISMISISSRTSVGILSGDNINSVMWYLNDQLISFDAITKYSLTLGSGTVTSIPGYFYATKDANGIPTLKICKNLPDITMGQSCTIKCVVNFTSQTYTDTISATYTIPINQGKQSGYRATIVSEGDSTPFTIVEKGGSCTLAAVLYNNGTIVTSSTATPLYYQWYKQSVSGNNSIWVTVAGATSRTLTVTDADVDTYGVYRCGIYVGGTKSGDTYSGGEWYYDSQSVMDASDPYEIDANPGHYSGATIDTNGNITSAGTKDGIEESISDSDEYVEYAPKLVKRGGTTSVSASFWFVASDAAGVTLYSTYNDSSKTSSGESKMDVTPNMCEQAGGDVAISIWGKASV